MYLTRKSSLERIDAYLNIEQEPKPTIGGTPPAYWPSSGDLQVEKLSARYSSDGPKVLDDISFNVKAGERVGIGTSSFYRPRFGTHSIPQLDALEAAR